MTLKKTFIEVCEDIGSKDTPNISLCQYAMLYKICSMSAKICEPEITPHTSKSTEEFIF